MPIDNALKFELETLDEAAIRRAHGILIADGYTFVGYHGCNHRTLMSIVPYNFDPAHVGTGGGLARGVGFYVAKSINLAIDYADESTQAGDPAPPLYNVIPRRPGNAGQTAVLRIYARNFSAMWEGTHYNWGVQSRAGDPGGNLNIHTLAGQNIQNCGRDLEIVFRTVSYPRLAAIPSLGDAVLDSSLPVHFNARKWRSHEL